MKTASLTIRSLFLIGTILGTGCSVKTGGQKTIRVFCGAASKPPMEEIAARFGQRTGIKVELNFGGSGTLLSQIELSRQGDIYQPGSADYILAGERKKLLLKGSDKIVAYLIPAIIVPAGNPAGIHSLEDLARPGVRLGLGNPETVCLGLYAIELLEKNGLLEAAMPNVVTMAESCEKTANLAALKKVDAVLGWSVFYDWNPQRLECVPIPAEKIPRISYVPITITAFARDKDLCRQFIDFVLSPDGQAIYRKYGYLTDREEARKSAPQAEIGGEYRLPARYFEILKTI